MTDNYRAGHPGALLDQYDAALRHTVTVQRQMMTALGGGALAPIVPAVARIIGRHAYVAATGGGQACEHVRAGSPQPLLAVAWRPGQVACGPCSVDALTCPPEDDQVCDGCGYERPDGVVLGNVTIGLLIVQYGLCGACRAGADLAAAPTAVAR